MTKVRTGPNCASIGLAQDAFAGVKHSSFSRLAQRRIAGSVRRQVVHDDEQPVPARPGSPDRLPRGQGVIGALMLAGDAPQLVIAHAVAAMEVADAVGAVISRAQPGRPFARREISVFLAPAFVIAVRQGVASELHGARQRVEQRPDLLAAGSSSALWASLDQVVDGYAAVVAGLERDIDQIEATVFSGAVAPTERIYSLRREATDFYRAVHPLLAVVATIERAASVPELGPYLRDVQDHLLLVNEEVAAQRDLLGTVLQANMAVISVEQTKVSVRQNATVEQLTILATVFLPLTFVTGFFGQNFGWLVGRIDTLPAFLFYGIGSLAVPLVLLFLWLRLRRPHPDIVAAARGN
jgi:Mg2+ and Co2+ transporter CorA